MLKFILKRLWYGVLVMFGVIILVFSLFQILPADASKMLMGQRSDISTSEAIIKELGLDKPKYVQLAGYFNDIMPISAYSLSQDSFFSFGKIKDVKHLTLVKTKNNAIVIKYPFLKLSYQTQRPVTEMISQAFPSTLVLASVSMLFALLLGISMGIISAFNKDSLTDKSILLGSVLGMALPSFLFAIIIAWVFAFLLYKYTGLNMTGSLFSIDDFGSGERLNLANLILPGIALGIRPLAVITELTRASVLDTLSMDFIRTAKAKGLPKTRIIINHVLKNSLNPIISSATGWFATMLAGSVFVESIFGWKGMGTLIVDSLDKYDMPVLMGCIVFISMLLVILNIISDILYAVVDPKVKLNE